MQIALFQPDIPQNTGTILRLCACLDVAAHIIEPAGFPVSDRHFRRAGMDYLDQVHLDASRFLDKIRGMAAAKRATGCCCSPPKAPPPILIFAIRRRTSCCSGAKPRACPTRSSAAADARLMIPIKPGLRSLNVAMAAAMAVGEALRQTGSQGI